MQQETHPISAYSLSNNYAMAPDATKRRGAAAALSAEEAAALPEFKRCAACKRTKPRVDFSFDRRRSRSGQPRVYLKAYCRACISQEWHSAMRSPAFRRAMRAKDARLRAAKLEHRRAMQAAAKRRRTRARQDALVAPYCAAVCAEYGITWEALCGLSRAPEMVEPRRVLAYLLVSDAHQGVSVVGRLLHRDHSTIIHHVAKMRSHKTWEEAQVVRRIKTAHGRLQGYRLPPPPIVVVTRKAG